MQSNYIHDERDKEIMHKSRARVETMSIIHEKLYNKTGSSKINLGNYFRDLSGHLFKIYNGRTNNIKSVIESDNIEVNIDTIIPCGLIINELISNSIKFANPSKENLEINIKLSKQQDIFKINYRDNGEGIDIANEMNNNDSLGLRIVNTLVDQLEGRMTVGSPGGAEFNIEFKEIKYKDRI
jgi:two-component sensor histidine kinase